MAPSGDAYHVDWVISSGDAHAANHRDWFTDYTPFTSAVESILGGGDIPVLGIGTVTLQLKAVSKNTKSRTLVLHDVLHVPQAICNVVGSMDEGSWQMSKDGGALYDKNQVKIGLIDMAPLPKLRLKGQAPGQSSQDPGFCGSVSILWGGDRRAQWEKHKAEMATVEETPNTRGSNTAADGSSYTPAEKQWLKKHYGGEFRFLRAHGWSIYKEEDREDGRKLARDLMLTEEDEGNDSDNSFLQELEEDPMSHLADHHFSDEQLDWIKHYWRHSANFMLAHGLKPYDDDDCKEGARLAQQLSRGAALEMV